MIEEVYYYFKVGELFLEDKSVRNGVKLAIDESDADKLHQHEYSRDKDIVEILSETKANLEKLGLLDVKIVKKKVVTSTVYNEMEVYFTIGMNDFGLRMRPRKVDESENV